MYESYESANLWSFITNTPEGLRVSFVKAEHSTFRWAGPEQAVISSHGHAVHTLHKSGHWVHADNPDGAYDCSMPVLLNACAAQCMCCSMPVLTIQMVCMATPYMWCLLEHGFTATA